MGKLGVSEHRWKGVPNDQPLSPAGQRQLESVAKELLASTDQVHTHTHTHTHTQCAHPGVRRD